MNRLRKVIGNTVISLLGQGVTWTSTIILTIAYGRFLGDVKFGELFFAITFVALIGFPIDAGFNQQLTRDVAQVPSEALRYVTNILCFKVILWMTLYGCILLLCTLLGYSSEIHMLVAICGVTLLSASIANLMGSLHYAFERVSFPVIGNILEKGLSALIGAILLEHGASVETMAFVLLGSSCANMLWQTAWVLRLVGLPCIIDIPLARKLLKKSIPFLLYGVLGVIYYNIDTILLSFMTSTAVIGWYGAAYRIFNTMVFLPSLVIGAVMYPIFSKLSTHSQTELKLAVEKSLNFLLFCGMPISVGLIVAAPTVVGFLYHRPDFVNTIPAMQFLAPGLLFLYINSVLTSVLICIGREKRIPLMAGIALVFNLGSNLFLIPLYQHVGAALVTSLTELLLTIFAFIFTPRPLWPLGSIKVGLKALLAGLVMGLVLWVMRQYSLLVILPVAALVYFGVAALLGTIPREDVRVLYTSIRHKAGSAKPNAEHTETTSEDVFFLTDEEMQAEQEFVFALGREMTNPVLPAFKYEMTQPLLPTHKSEIPTSKLEGMSGDITARLPDTPPLSVIEDNDATLLLKTVRPSRRRRTKDLSMVEDKDATLLLNSVRPLKRRKTKDLSNLRVEEDKNTTAFNQSSNKEQKNMKTL
jgi:O-antigen/teichoic acid export membrane protein